MHREPIAPSDLPESAQSALIERTVRTLAERGVTRVLVYPAGRHARRHGRDPFRRGGVDVVAFVDDLATGEIEGVGIVRPTEAPEGAQAVVISADAREREFAERAREWARLRDLELVRPYAAFADPADPGRARTASAEITRLRSTCNGMLNLGCGDMPLAGWTNVGGGDGTWYGAPDHPDVIALDAFRAMAALDDGSCRFIYSEHFYEHFTLEEGADLAREWARLLRPGGVVRVVTPDLAREARLMLGEDLPAEAGVIENHRRAWLGRRHTAEVSRFLTPAMVFNFSMRLDGHRFVYDEPTLRLQLEHAGFTGVTRRAFGRSEWPELDGIDAHDGGATGRGWIEGIQLVVEATRA